MKMALRIMILVVAGFFALLPDIAYAQLDAAALARANRRGENVSLGGTNPYDTTQEEGEEGEQEDSTKVKRIRKPLESYYFGDSVRALPNFMWHVSREMNDVKIMPMDTTLEQWRIDYPYYRNGVGDITLGGLGQ